MLKRYGLALAWLWWFFGPAAWPHYKRHPAELRKAWRLVGLYSRAGMSTPTRDMPF